MNRLLAAVDESSVMEMTDIINANSISCDTSTSVQPWRSLKS